MVGNSNESNVETRKNWHVHIESESNATLRPQCNLWLKFVGSLLSSKRFFSSSVFAGFCISTKTKILFDLRFHLICSLDPQLPEHLCLSKSFKTKVIIAASETSLKVLQSLRPQFPKKIICDKSTCLILFCFILKTIFMLNE